MKVRVCATAREFGGCSIVEVSRGQDRTTRERKSTGAEETEGIVRILRDRWEERPLSRMLTLGCENTRRATKIAIPTFEKRFISESERLPSSRENSSSSSSRFLSLQFFHELSRTFEDERKDLYSDIDGNPENGLFHGKLHGALTSRFGTARLPPEPFLLPFFFRELALIADKHESLPAAFREILVRTYRVIGKERKRVPKRRCNEDRRVVESERAESEGGLPSAMGGISNLMYHDKPK
uniref:Uncharacterized protein n=1 Tax=Vespula pensylvanica TaxID=30213 RepID=A0A834P6P4_VESPE|nr:hypothetical protein H0235_006482 [Vespula pensylvanica]